MLVAFEGIDGSGKSTLIHEVAARLKKSKLKPIVTQEPTDTWIGKKVRSGIRNHMDPLVQAGLFLADRAVHLTSLAFELRRGELILTDRYVDSTTAYQAAALKDRVPLALDLLRGFQRGLFPRPDLVVLLDLAPKTALKRIKGRKVKEPYEAEKFLTRVRSNYQRLAREDKERWLVLDAERPVKQLAETVAKRIRAEAA